MKTYVIVGLFCLGTLLACQQAQQPAVAADKVVLDSEQKKASYAIGFDIARNIKKREVELDVSAFLAGIQAGYTGQGTLMTEEEVQAALELFRKNMREQTMAKQQKAAEENKAKGDAFREEFKAKEGVQITESGLMYTVVTPAEGDMPKDGDVVKVHYRGTLVDGTEFDSSYKRGEPATFSLNGVIKGWQEGLKLMPVGSKYQFVIPPELAYGPRGAGGTIGPNATLVFDVELLGIEKPEEKQEPQKTLDR